MKKVVKINKELNTYAQAQSTYNAMLTYQETYFCVSEQY